MMEMRQQIIVVTILHQKISKRLKKFLSHHKLMILWLTLTLVKKIFLKGITFQDSKRRP